MVSQWQIGKPRVLAGEAPRCLAVPRDVKRGEHFIRRSFPWETSDRPLPVRDVLGIDAELVCVVFTFYLLVEQELSNVGSFNL